jgi:hypothetical protein
VPAFADLVATFLDDLFVLQPDVATAVGDHRYDDRWPYAGEAGRAPGSRSWTAGRRRSRA